jgi:hypothetical protein
VGLISVFVVASPEDALQYGSLLQSGKALPANRFQRAEYKNLTPLALGMLWGNPAPRKVGCEPSLTAFSRARGSPGLIWRQRRCMGAGSPVQTLRAPR